MKCSLRLVRSFTYTSFSAPGLLDSSPSEQFPFQLQNYTGIFLVEVLCNPTIPKLSVYSFKPFLPCLTRVVCFVRNDEWLCTKVYCFCDDANLCCFADPCCCFLTCVMSRHPCLVSCLIFLSANVKTTNIRVDSYALNKQAFFELCSFSFV